MNIKKLSQLAGVSPGTISKAFNGSQEISEATRAKIFEIAKQYNCFERYNKLKYTKKVVAVICPEVKSEYYCSIVSYIEKSLHKLGVMMVLSISEFSTEKEEELINTIIYNNIANIQLYIKEFSQKIFFLAFKENDHMYFEDPHLD